MLDLVPAATLSVNATPADNTINYTAGAAGNGLVTVDNFESIEFSNKVALTINAGVGDDKINLNNTGSPSSADEHHCQRRRRRGQSHYLCWTAHRADLGRRGRQ